MLYLTKSNNEFFTSAAVELETLNAIEVPQPGQKARKQALNRLVEVTREDKTLFYRCIGVLMGIGLLGMIYGFRQWHTKIQPLQDEMAELQLRKLRAELAQMQRPSRTHRAR